MSYSIGETAKMLGIPASTLRYYDKEGLLPFVDRSSGGIRVFNDADIESLRLIECLKKSGLSIKDIHQFMIWIQEGNSTLVQRREMFHRQRDEVRARMSELQKTLDVVEYKCWFYDTAVERGSSEAVHEIPDEELPERVLAAREILQGRNQPKSEETPAA